MNVHVSSSVVSETVAGGLEVDGVLPSGQVGRSEIGGTGDEFGDGDGDLGEESLGEFSGGDGLVLGSEGGESGFPTGGELSGESSRDVGVLLGVLLSVRDKHLVPSGFGGGSLGGDFGVEGGGGFRDGEELFGVESELGLDGDGVVDLEGVSVNTVRSLILGSVSDGGSARAYGERTMPRVVKERLTGDR